MIDDYCEFKEKYLRAKKQTNWIKSLKLKLSKQIYKALKIDNDSKAYALIHYFHLIEVYEAPSKYKALFNKLLQNDK